MATEEARMAALNKAVSAAGGTEMLLSSILGIILGVIGLAGSAWAISAFQRLRKQSTPPKMMDSSGLYLQIFLLVVSLVTIAASIIVIITGRNKIRAALLAGGARVRNAYGVLTS